MTRARWCRLPLTALIALLPRLAESQPPAPPVQASHPIGPAFDGRGHPRQSLPASFLGRWVSNSRTMQVSRLALTKGLTINGGSRALQFEIVEAVNGKYTLEGVGPLGVERLTIQMEGSDLLVESVRSPELIERRKELGLEGGGVVKERWKRPVTVGDDWMDRAEQVIDQWATEGDFRSALEKAHSVAWSAPVEVVDVYTTRDRGYLEVNVLLNIDQRPWVWRFNKEGDAQAGFNREMSPRQGRSFVYLVRPFNSVDLPEPLVEWIRLVAQPRIRAALKWPAPAPPPPLPGLPGLRLFDSVETILRVCPDAQPDLPDMGMTIYRSNTCGASLLGGGTPVHFAFHQGSLRGVWQRFASRPEANRESVARRLLDLQASTCLEVQARMSSAQDTLICQILRGEVAASVDEGIDIWATTVPL